MPRDPHDQQNLDTVTLLQYVFNQMCLNDNVGEQDRGRIAMPYFLEWLKQFLDHPEVSCSTVCSSLNIPEEIWSTVRLALAEDHGQAYYAQFWNMICFGHRPRPENPLQRIQVNFVLTWQDGRVTPIHLIADASMIQDGGGFTDGLVGDLLTRQVKDTIGRIMAEGLAGMYTKSEDMRGPPGCNDPYEVMMGLILRNINQVDPKLHEGIKRWFRLAQVCLRMPLPPTIADRIRATKQSWQADAASEPSAGKERGGFDLG